MLFETARKEVESPDAKSVKVFVDRIRHEIPDYFAMRTCLSARTVKAEDIVREELKTSLSEIRYIVRKYNGILEDLALKLREDTEASVDMEVDTTAFMPIWKKVTQAMKIDLFWEEVGKEIDRRCSRKLSAC